jgi:hypothetical protein
MGGMKEMEKRNGKRAQVAAGFFLLAMTSYD